MTAPLSVPSVYTIMIALEEIESAIRHQPSPEDNAAGKDLGMPVLHLGGKGFDRVGRLIPSDADEAAATSERPVVIFEVPPKVTDAEVFEALGEDSGEVARQLPIKGTDALGWYVTFHQRAAQHGISSNRGCRRVGSRRAGRSRADAGAQDRDSFPFDLAARAVPF